MTTMTNFTKTMCISLALTILFANCASTTMIQSRPSGAKIYVNGEPVGTTPYTHRDTKIIGTTTTVKLEKEGYDPLNTSFARDEQPDIGAIIGGFFFLFPFLWTMKYNPTHTYELTPISNQSIQNTTNYSQNNNSTNELIKLKNLLDQQAITSDDFTTLKVKILNGQYNCNESIADQLIQLKSLFESNLLTKDEYTSQKNKLVNAK